MTGLEPVTSENPDWLQHIVLWPLSYMTIKRIAGGILSRVFGFMFSEYKEVTL